MKYILQSILTVCAISSAIAAEKLDKTSAPEINQNLKEWTETFNTKIGEVIHTPQMVSLGGFMISGSSLNIAAKTFNGVPLLSPIVLKVNSSREQFTQAMRNSGVID